MLLNYYFTTDFNVHSVGQAVKLYFYDLKVALIFLNLNRLTLVLKLQNFLLNYVQNKLF